MGVTSKLLALHRVDRQLIGLKSRLRAAEKYLEAQNAQLGEISVRYEAVAGQIRQLEAQEHNDEVEARSLDERIASLRERMNTASTSKQHQALLTEVNTVKADKSLVEERALEALGKLDELRAQLATIEEERSEREKVRGVAESDRDTRAAEIKDRVDELERERVVVEKDVPPSALAEYRELLDLGAEDVMAEVSEQDRRNKEYVCGSCYTILPVEQVNVLLNRGDLQRCPTCRVILYIADELRDSLGEAAEKKRKRREANVG